ncbi:phage virion morphogenesis protein [Shewanella subflava]|uniref:Phage virion morphogenesis protein n=1 Tax=Shewanella subflava TaxID=2986476 RepID=A0ABT3I5H7_9GAMM|nr:phage virion morphogenesis protein [Shewanella subflava]MCW3171219.1 phage virion morphogenesis protein [Shewanella subflava]
MNFKVNVNNLKETQLQLALLALPLKKRRRAMWRMADSVRKKSQTRAKQQKSPDGTPWAPIKRKRKAGGKRDKMFRKIPNYMRISQPKETSDLARVYFQPQMPGKGKFSTGVIANMHSTGYTITRNKAEYSASMQRYEARKGHDKGNATRAQAKYLIKLGMKRRVAKSEVSQRKKLGAYTVRATAGWIVENISYMQAGMLITKLKNESKSSKPSWNIKLPAREILGANVEEQTKIFKRVMQGINHGWNVKKQDMKG